MMKTSDFVNYLAAKFPSIKFYNGVINKNDTNCVSVYNRGSAPIHLAVGGKENTSYSILPILILVHWSESTEDCNIVANSIYQHLFGLSNVVMENTDVISIDLLDPCPVSIGRDEKNIVEMSFRLHIYYKREES